jgi:hypothetical protein
MDRDGMSNLYRGPSIYASYQVLVHLAKRLQKRRFFFKSANQKQESPMAAMFVNGAIHVYDCICFIKKTVFLGKGR